MPFAAPCRTSPFPLAAVSFRTVCGLSITCAYSCVGAPRLRFGAATICRLPSHVSLPQLGVPRLLGTIYPSPLFFEGNQHQNPSSGRILKCLLILAACAFNRSWYYCSGLWVDLWSCLFPPFVYLRHRRNPHSPAAASLFIILFN